ncbi:MAG: AIM24 family protein [Methyloprofundus sp.]|nr:AIM24 family protein [Methyloprofundus sp.]
MRCHELDYEMIGHDIQMLEVELDPNATVIAEAGAIDILRARYCF